MNRTDVKIDENGMSIGGRRKRGLFSAVFSRTGLIVLFLVVQVLVTLAVWNYFGELVTKYFLGGQTVFELIMLVFLLNDGKDANYKLSWMLLIVAAPFFGVLLYIWMQADPGNRVVKRRMNKLSARLGVYAAQDGTALSALQRAQPDSASLARYVYKTVRRPVYAGTSVKYFSGGEAVFEEMLRQLRGAEKFIFLEFFIIREGYMWGKVLEILAEKAGQGVEVRVVYDGSCEMGSTPRFYPERLAELGIGCKVWLRLKPFITSAYNYRDHRKILVVDGRVAFNGGVNLSDEYINRAKRFGHWKDAAVLLRGRAVRSYTEMFLEMWNFDEKEPEDFSPYLAAEAQTPADAKGFVLPYSDSPLDSYRTGKMVYEDILNTAKEYVYIMTPYLIPDGELESSLKFAAERGVDVRILMPGVPDKKLVWFLAKRYYAALIASGVRIYEYTPGFVHSKVFVSDERKAVVGTVNLDYRSLYHHFECGTYMVDVPCTAEIKADFLDALGRSREIAQDGLRQEKLYRRIIGAVMKLISPLL